MAAVLENMAAAVGSTPLVRIHRLGSGRARVLAKLESTNPCASVKDRIAKYMVEAAQREGQIKPDTVLVEPTSGNTGIGLAFICDTGERYLSTELFANLPEPETA